MVSTRQMSITTVGPETGSTGVNTNSNISSRMTSNSLSQQSNSTRQQTNNNQTVGGGGTTVNADAVTHSNDDKASTSDDKPKQLSDMPLEIFERIFQYSGYKEVSNMRLVSTQMNQICKTILNSTFTKLQTQLTKRFHNIKKTMPRRESVRRSHPLSYECDIIETCCMRLSLLQMTFGRHIEHKHICFFPGAILDEVYNVLNCIRTTPNPACRPFKITEELIDLSTMAIEFFKSDLEPLMPQIGALKHFYGKSSTTTRTSSKNCYLYDTQSTSAGTISTRSSQSSSMPSPPQSNMVLRKGIRKIKQGMKKYNNQLSVLRTDLRFCKRKSSDQAKQITELQNVLAEQQKQTLEYANRLDENDKKNDEMSSKVSTLLQELNKCKIELHYHRSKSPAAPFCNNCGQTTLTIPPDNLLAYINNNSREEIFNVLGKCSNFESKKQSHESCISQDLTRSPSTAIMTAAAEPAAAAAATAPVTPTMKITPNYNNNKSNETNKILLVTTDDNTDTLDAMHGLKMMTSSPSSLSLSSSLLNSSGESSTSEIIVAAEETLTSVSAPQPSLVRLTTPTICNRENAIIESLEKRYKKPPAASSNILIGDDNWPMGRSDSYGLINSGLSSILAANASSTLATASTAPPSSSFTIKTATKLKLNVDGNDSMAGKKSIVNSNGSSNSNSSVILTVGTPRFYGKRKLDESNMMDQLNDATMMSDSNTITIGNSPNENRLLTSAAAAAATTVSSAAATAITNKSNDMATNNLANSNLSDNYNKKARRVQNKLKIQTNSMNIKTRNK